MKITKVVSFLLCLHAISLSSGKSLSKRQVRTGLSAQTLSKARKLCLGCMHVPGHQNPYMYSMQSINMGFSPLPGNPMTGMLSPMLGMSFSPYMAGLGFGAFPLMNSPFMSGGMGGMNMYGPRLSGYSDASMDQRVYDHLMRNYSNAVRGNFSRQLAKQILNDASVLKAQKSDSSNAEIQQPDKVTSHRRKLKTRDRGRKNDQKTQKGKPDEMKASK